MNGARTHSARKEVTPQIGSGSDSRRRTRMGIPTAIYTDNTLVIFARQFLLRPDAADLHYPT